MTFTGNVLALDLATTTGWAYGEPGALPIFGHIRFGKPGDPHGQTLRAFRTWLEDNWGSSKARMRPALIVYESPAVPAFMGKKTNINTTRLLMGFAEHTEEWCYNRFELHEATTSQVRCHFIGNNPKSHIAKPQVYDRCHDLGWMCATHDESDACALWNYQCSLIDPMEGIKTSPLFKKLR
jgi:hypothetical protein